MHVVLKQHGKEKLKIIVFLLDFSQFIEYVYYMINF